MHPDFEFRDLEPAAGVEVRVAPGEERGPVFYCAGEGPDVDVVVFCADPFVFGVVDYEFYVWGHPLGLDGGEIGSYYVGFWVETWGGIELVSECLRCQEGYETYSAKSIAQIPVPVPMSRTRLGLSMGAR